MQQNAYPNGVPSDSIMPFAYRVKLIKNKSLIPLENLDNLHKALLDLHMSESLSPSDQIFMTHVGRLIRQRFEDHKEAQTAIST